MHIRVRVGRCMLARGFRRGVVRCVRLTKALIDQRGLRAPARGSLTISILIVYVVLCKAAARRNNAAIGDSPCPASAGLLSGMYGLARRLSITHWGHGFAEAHGLG